MTLFCDPWEEDGIEFNRDKISGRGFDSVKRNESDGTGYLFTNGGDVKEYTAKKLLMMGWATKKAGGSTEVRGGGAESLPDEEESSADDSSSGGICTPWEADDISFVSEKILSKYKYVERDTENRSGYLFTELKEPHNKRRFDVKKILMMGYATKGKGSGRAEGGRVPVGGRAADRSRAVDRGRVADERRISRSPKTCNLDLVFCIDVSFGMKSKETNIRSVVGKIINTISETGTRYYSGFNLRLNFLFFGAGQTGESYKEGIFMIPDRFLSYPADKVKYEGIINNMIFQEEDGNRSHAIQALGAAMFSEWGEKKDVRRQVILVITDRVPDTLEMREAFIGSYPLLPQDNIELCTLWHGLGDIYYDSRGKFADATLFKSLDKEHSILGIIAPPEGCWKEMRDKWDRCWLAENNLSDSGIRFDGLMKLIFDEK